MINKSNKLLANKTVLWIVIAALIFAAINAIAMGFEIYFIFLLPFVLLLLFYYFFHMKNYILP